MLKRNIGLLLIVLSLITEDEEKFIQTAFKNNLIMNRKEHRSLQTCIEILGYVVKGISVHSSERKTEKSANLKFIAISDD